jgi:hypothetical protein
LIHGGTGLLFGPLGWLAAFAAGRLPGVAAVLLLAPVAWLVRSWAPILLDAPPAQDWLIVAALTVPGSIAASVFLRRAVRPHSHVGETE